MIDRSSNFLTSTVNIRHTFDVKRTTTMESHYQQRPFRIVGKVTKLKPGWAVLGEDLKNLMIQVPSPGSSRPRTFSVPAFVCGFTYAALQQIQYIQDQAKCSKKLDGIQLGILKYRCETLENLQEELKAGKTDYEPIRFCAITMAGKWSPYWEEIELFKGMCRESMVIPFSDSQFGAQNK